jgi:prevent-host-death family protein
MKSQTKTINVTEFKAKCLSLFDKLTEDGIVVTKHGEPIARILPIGKAVSPEFIGAMKGKIQIHADIQTTGTTWQAES